MLLARPLFLALLTAASHPSGLRAAALPDTGLFAPVADHWAGIQEDLAGLSADADGARRVRALLLCGRPDEAARIAKTLSGAKPENMFAQARAALAVQDFAAAAPLIAQIATIDSPEARSIRYRWEYARDNAAAIDSLTRARLLSGDSGNEPELLAAGRVAYDLLNYARADSLFTRAPNA